MAMKLAKRFLAILFLATVGAVSAQVSPLEEDTGDSYYYVDHYEVVLDKRLSEVWPILADLASWMPGLAEANDTIPATRQGAVFHLYDDFYIEVAKVIRDRMILLVNLPNSQEGEDTQGIAMISVHEIEDGTMVSIFMSRIYFWFEAQDNPLRDRRESREFAESRRASYEDDVLRRLQEAVDNAE